MKVEERVVKSMTAGMAGDYVFAASIICPAIEATARSLLGKSKIGANEYKQFLRQNYWLLERFIGEGIDLSDTVFPDQRMEFDGGRLLVRPDFADIIYHMHRCATAHGHDLSGTFDFLEPAEQGRHKWWIQAASGLIMMPVAVVWALIAVVVFSSANKDVCTRTSLWLTWGDMSTTAKKTEPYKFEIDVFWGGEDLVRAFFLKRPAIRVALKFQ